MLNFNFYIKASGPDDFTTGSDHLWSDGEWHQVYPLRDRDFGIVYEDDWPRRRKILSGDLQFVDRIVNGSRVLDYERLSQVASRDIKLSIKIDRITDIGTEELWLGYFSLSDGKHNPSKGIFSVTPTVDDAYRTILENKDYEINIANLYGREVLTVNFRSETILAISNITQLSADDYKLENPYPSIRQSWDLYTAYPVAEISETNQEYEGVNYWDNYTGRFLDLYGEDIGLYRIWIWRKEIFREDPGAGWQDEAYFNNPGVWSKPVSEKQIIETQVGNGRALRFTDVIQYIVRYIMNLNQKTAKYRSTFFDSDPTPESKFSTPMPYDSTKTYSELVSENYVTGETNILTGLCFFPKSEVPIRSDRATVCMISFSDLIDGLKNLFNVDWYIDDEGYLRIEHYSWFDEDSISIDLTTLSDGRYINKLTETTYDKGEMPSRDHFTMPDTGGVDFRGKDIIYDQARGVDDQREISTSISTDIEYIIHHEDKVDFEKYAMVVTSGGVILSETGELSGREIANGHLSWANLHKRYWMHGRPYKNGNINGVDVDFKGFVPTVIQQEIIFPALSVDPMKLIKTEVGSGRPLEMSYRFSDSTYRVSLAYPDIDVTTNLTPVVVTDDVTEVVTSTAVCGGSIVSGGPILAKGCCWRPGTFGVPTIDDSKTEDGTGTDDFVSHLTGLNPGTTYRVRAYAVNSHGVGYGLSRVFTAGSIAAPVVVTGTISEIQPTSAKCGGTVTYEGSSSVIERGACWSSTGVPDITGYHQSSGTGSGAFTVDLTGLSAGVVYDIRTYAINEYGVSYGQIASFITASLSPPTVATDNPTYIRQNSVTFSGLAITEVGSSISERGFIYCLDSIGRDPDYSLDTVLDAGDGEGSFTASTNYPTVLLEPNTAYRVRAYAINEFGIGYGNTKNFTTLDLATPTVQTVRVYNILTDAVTIDGLITSNGGWTLTYGFCYKKATTGDPTVADTNVYLGSGTWVTNFSSTIGSLDPGAYRIRVYVQFSGGYVYGETMAFSLAEGDQLLAVSTDTGISVYGRTATASGSAISGDTISESGLLIRVASQGIPTTALYSAKYTNSSGGNGAFSYTFTGLTASTNYYVRAYAMIDSVPYYGDYRLFKSGAAIPPTVTTRVTSWVGGDKAYAGGNITAGDAAITARGVCWIQATTGNPTTANDKTTDGTGAGVFDSTLSVLTAGLTYRYRAYAVTADGTTYGTTLSFNTMTFYPPNVVSRFVEDIGPFSAKMSGFAISENTITARGFLLKQASSGDPTLSDTVVSSDSGQGYFEEVIDGLAGETDYRIRAYATDGVGTGYGETRGFTTRSVLPVVSDAEIYSITGDGFWISASITDEGGSAIEQCGVCYYTGSYVGPADVEDYVVLSNGVSQEFSVYVRGYIFPSTSVQFRVFAQNAYGIGYGSNQNQTTTAGYRAVVTTGGIVIQQTSAIVGGNVIDEGDQTVVSKGICWLAGTSHPMVGDNPVSGGSGLGAYYCQMTGLTANITYTVCAYATDTLGYTSYGQAKTFTTLQEEPE